jgi:hypothetical protein
MGVTTVHREAHLPTVSLLINMALVAVDLVVGVVHPVAEVRVVGVMKDLRGCHS